VQVSYRKAVQVLWARFGHVLWRAELEEALWEAVPEKQKDRLR
jgi:hypothetical protein